MTLTVLLADNNIHVSYIAEKKIAIIKERPKVSFDSIKDDQLTFECSFDALEESGLEYTVDWMIGKEHVHSVSFSGSKVSGKVKESYSLSVTETRIHSGVSVSLSWISRGQV